MKNEAMRGVPDAIHHTDTSETLEYIQGWNDCRAAMLAEQPAQQEPVGKVNELFDESVIEQCGFDRELLVYTSPQPAQRTWVGLTDDEAESVIDEIPGFAFGLDDGNLANGCVVLYAKAIEAKLKEKNT